jgi:hypothetical protein
MNTNPGRETAKILTFPAGGRAGVVARREEYLLAANVSVRPLPSTVICDSWYHEAAVRDADKPH